MITAELGMQLVIVNYVILVMLFKIKFVSEIHLNLFQVPMIFVLNGKTEYVLDVLQELTLTRMDDVKELMLIVTHGINLMEYA